MSFNLSGVIPFITGTRFRLTAVLTEPWTGRPSPTEGEACLPPPCSHAMPTVAATYSKETLNVMSVLNTCKIDRIYFMVPL